jgi:Relaxase/Mobilisation nuclease domain/Large polyvalent protein-associated domain 7
MIAKKVRNPLKSSSKTTRIQRLVEYIRNPERNGTEKNVYDSARGFIAEERESQRLEMQGLANAATRSRDPINHYVLSWKEGEEPSPKQVERAVDIFLEELKMEKHQAIYALHADTKHYHLHLVVNRVDPDTEKVNANRHDYEAIHRAIARIEHEQRWEREERGRYQLTAQGEVERSSFREGRPQAPSQEKRDRELRTGEKSAERLAIEASEAIRAARSWRQLHQGLAEKGLRFEKKGSGAVLLVGEVPVKASSLGKAYSLGSLQKRLGSFVPSPKNLEVKQRFPEPLVAAGSSWRLYQLAKTTHEQRKRTDVSELRARHADEKQTFAQEQQARKAQVLAGDWKGRGRELNLQRSLLAGEKAAARAALKEKQAKESQALRQKYRPFPSFQKWLQREKTQETPTLPLRPQNRAVGELEALPASKDIRDFRAEVVRNEVRYQTQEDKTAFIDRSRRVDVYDYQSKDSVRAVLQLSAEKWGSFKVEGKKEFIDHAVQLAAEHGFRLNNPELQQRIQLERTQLLEQQRVLEERARQEQQREEKARLERQRARSGPER